MRSENFAIDGQEFTQKTLQLVKLENVTDKMTLVSDTIYEWLSVGKITQTDHFLRHLVLTQSSIGLMTQAVRTSKPFKDSLNERRNLVKKLKELMIKENWSDAEQQNLLRSIE